MSKHYLVNGHEPRSLEEYRIALSFAEDDHAALQLRLSDSVPKWAPMSEGRPAYLLGVILYFPDTRAQAVGCLDVDDRWCVGGERTANTPTHWMPLPEAPK